MNLSQFLISCLFQVRIAFLTLLLGSNFLECMHKPVSLFKFMYACFCVYVCVHICIYINGLATFYAFILPLYMFLHFLPLYLQTT